MDDIFRINNGMVSKHERNIITYPVKKIIIFNFDTIFDTFRCHVYYWITIYLLIKVNSSAVLKLLFCFCEILLWDLAEDTLRLKNALTQSG